MLVNANTERAVIIRSAKDLGSAVRARRKALDLDQAALATQVGVSRQWIGALERGKPGAELALVLRTLRALDLPLQLGTPATGGTAGSESVDIDAIVARARDHG